MTKPSKKSRALIIEKMNKRILECQSPEIRQQIINEFSFLLMDLNIYNGFNYIHWLEKGHADWVAAGKPDDTTPFLGDQTLIKYY